MSSHGVAANATSAGRNEPMRARRHVPKADEPMIPTHEANATFGHSRSAASCRTHAPRQTTCALASLFDHLVGAREQRGWDREAECLGGLEVDHEVVLGRHLHWQITCFLALKNAIYIGRRAPVEIDDIGIVRH